MPLFLLFIHLFIFIQEISSCLDKDERKSKLTCFTEQSFSEGSLKSMFNVNTCPLPETTDSIYSDQRDINHLLPSDFKIIMSIGDSFTTGLAARSDNWLDPSQWIEFPGITFACGGDDEAVTLPNFFKHYQPNKKELIGVSKGSRGFKSCLGICVPEWIYIPETDGLNAGISGGRSSELQIQVDYLLERLNCLLKEQQKLSSEKQDRKDWKFISLFIGMNDICSGSCNHVFDDDDNAVGHFNYYRLELIKALERIRKACPNTIIQLIQLFDISKYADTLQNNPNCQHIDWIWRDYICPCAKNNLGKNNLKKRIDKFNQILEQVWRSYRKQNEPKYSDFAIILSPVLKNINFTTNFQTAFASQFDCTHPSLVGHAHLSVILWNQLFVPSSEKHKINFTLPMKLYCPTSTDFIQVV